MRILQLVFIGLIILLSNSCRSTEKMNTLSFLTNNTWELSSLMGDEMVQSKFPDGLPSLSFLEGGKLEGFAGCNNFSGGFSLEGTSVKLDPGAMTRKACEGVAEDEFISAMSKVKNIKAGKDKLTLLDGTTEIMRLIPTSK